MSNASIRYVPGAARSSFQSDSSLSRYLREMSSLRLIDRRRESRLARIIAHSREALAEIALDLGERRLRQLLDGATIGPERGRDWPVRDVQRFYDSLTAQARAESEEAGRDLRRALEAADKHLRRLGRARDALVTANLRLVVRVARQYVRTGIPLSDLIQEGNFGLLKAVERFDHGRGNRFSTYAVWWIRQSIERSVALRGRMIHLPRHISERRAKIAVTTGELRQEMGREPSSEEIAERLQWNPTDVDRVFGLGREPLTLDAPGTREGPELSATLPDPKATLRFENLEAQNLYERIERVMHRLTPRERRVLRLRFGLVDGAPRTLERVAREVRMSREGVRQVELGALRKLQRARPLAELSRPRRRF